MLKAQGKSGRVAMTERTRFDLEDRLVAFAGEIIDVVENLPASRAGGHVAGQLIRSGTSPAANYGEAQSAESRKDFVHKMRISLKELRETRVWLKIVSRKSMAADTGHLQATLGECQELLRIFGASIQTASGRR